MAINIFAYVGAIGDPMAVPWICRKCSLLNANELLFSMSDRMLIMDCSDSGVSMLFSFNISIQAWMP